MLSDRYMYISKLCIIKSSVSKINTIQIVLISSYLALNIYINRFPILVIALNKDLIIWIKTFPLNCTTSQLLKSHRPCHHIVELIYWPFGHSFEKIYVKIAQFERYGCRNLVVCIFDLKPRKFSRPNIDAKLRI